MAAHVEYRVDIGLGGTGKDWHATPSLIGNDGDDLFALLKTQTDEFSHASVGIKTGNFLPDQPLRDSAQFGFVDFAVFRVGSDVGNKNTFD